MSDRFKNRSRSDSIRHPRWDYTFPGCYFITIVTHQRVPFFGYIHNGLMVPNEAGRVVEEVWHEIPGHFDDTTVDAFVVMPDHVHGIILLWDFEPADGGSPCGGDGGCPRQAGGITGAHNPMITAHSIGKIVRWFKGKSSYRVRREYGLQVFGWQSSFHDRIVHTARGLRAVRNYIINNPANYRPP